MQLYDWTGNPWVDAGIVTILEYTNKKNVYEINLDDLQSMSMLMQELYMEHSWQTNLYSVFPNHPVTQSYGIKTSQKNKQITEQQRSENIKKLRFKQKEEFRNLLNQMINSITPLSNHGDCIACGRRMVREQRNRMYIPLSGYAGSHFFSFTTEGVDYCNACTFAIQCSPMIFYKCINLMLIHSNSHKVMRYWAKKCIDNINRQRAQKNFTGCLNEKYIKPVNALFHITQELILQYEENWVEENASMRIYHFTNYNQGPALEIYDLPTPVFRFLAYVGTSHEYRKKWKLVVRRGYKNIEGKKEDVYKNYPNSVYQCLLDGRSILGFFIDNSRKAAIGEWRLLTFYLQEVLHMEKTRIETIKKLGDDVAEIIQTSSNGKRRLGQFEMASNYASFRNVLLKLMKDQIKRKADTPLITFENVVDNIFPEGALGWKEIQDLLLFRIYEVLHSWLLQEGIVKEEDDENEEQTETTNNQTEVIHG